MDINELLKISSDMIVQTASDAVATVFNATPVPFRPVALAALRISVESAVATMSEVDRAFYTDTLENLTCTARKIPKGGDGT